MTRNQEKKNKSELDKLLIEYILRLHLSNPEITPSVVRQEICTLVQLNILTEINLLSKTISTRNSQKGIFPKELLNNKLVTKSIINNSIENLIKQLALHKKISKIKKFELERYFTGDQTCSEKEEKVSITIKKFLSKSTNNIIDSLNRFQIEDVVKNFYFLQN